MEYLFPVSGVETYLWLPPLVSLVLSFFCSMAGVSGAFLLLPFQMSVLGFTSPAVSPTNMVYNVVAIPSGVYRYMREGRLVWPLVWVVIAGTLPGVVAGAFLRLHFFPDPRHFRVFVGIVLLYMAGRLLVDLVRTMGRRRRPPVPAGATASSAGATTWNVQIREFSHRRIVYAFQGRDYQCGAPSLFLLSLIVGVVGGVYGIGGGAILAPIFVAIYRLPIHTVAGATLAGTLVTSLFGVLLYQIIAPFYAQAHLTVAPDWLLGALFGLGGVCGMYLGARTQRYVAAGWLKLLLGLLLLYVALSYVLAALL